MLNQVSSQLIQAQQSAKGYSGSHANKSGSEQFNNILAREVTNKESAPEPGNPRKNVEKANGKTEQTANNQTPEKNGNNNGNAVTATDTATKTNEGENSPAATSAIDASTNNPAGNVQTKDGLEMEQLHGFSAMNVDNIISATVVQPLVPAESAAPLKATAGFGDKGAGIMPGLGMVTAAMMQSAQSGSSQGFMQNFNDQGNNIWQKLQAGYTGATSELSFADEVGSEMLSRIGEIDPSLYADTDMPQHVGHPGLGGVTHGAAQSALHAVAPHSASLDTQMGQPKWGHDFSQKIVWLAHQNHQVAELKLNPAHLGPVEIMLSLSGDNGTQAAAQFVSPHLAVREAIEAALPRLREMMAESGIQLGDVMVGSESFSRNENNQQHGQQHARNMNHFGSQGETDPGMEKQTVSGGHNGIVNTFA